jgi:hypothetical protein
LIILKLSWPSLTPFLCSLRFSGNKWLCGKYVVSNKPGTYRHPWHPSPKKLCWETIKEANHMLTLSGSFCQMRVCWSHWCSSQELETLPTRGLQDNIGYST